MNSPSGPDALILTTGPELSLGADDIRIVSRQQSANDSCPCSTQGDEKR